MTKGGKHSQYKDSLWIFFYFITNLALTLYSKWLLSGTAKFNFPVLVSSTQLVSTGFGAFLIYKCLNIQTAKKDKREELVSLLKCSTLFTLNIVVNNISLGSVSLSFHQMIRSAAPIFTVVLEFLFKKKVHPFLSYLSLVPLVLGVILTTLSEYSAVKISLIDLFLTIFGVFLASSKGIYTYYLLKSSHPFHALELLWKTSPLCFVQSLIISLFLGEFGRLKKFYETCDNIHFAYSKLLVNGILALLLNWAGFTANKKTSPLAMNVAGNVKQVCSIFLGVLFFDAPISFLTSIGIIVTIIGGSWFTFISYKAKQRKLLKSFDDLEISAPRNQVKSNKI